MTTTVDGVPPDAQAQLNGLLQADAAKGRVAVHTFDPNASPQEKAAAAGQGRDQLKPITAEKDTGGTGASCLYRRLLSDKLTYNGHSARSGHGGVDSHPNHYHLGRGRRTPR